MLRRRRQEIEDTLWAEIRSGFDDQIAEQNGSGGKLPEIDESLLDKVYAYDSETRHQKLGEVCLHPLYPRHRVIELVEFQTTEGSR